MRHWSLQRRLGRWLAGHGLLGGFGEPPVASGVREPRRPRPPQLSGAVALDEPATRDD